MLIIYLFSGLPSGRFPTKILCFLYTYPCYKPGPSRNVTVTRPSGSTKGGEFPY
jgi:hypothetical protein